ncbi:MAG: PEP/pyruvate-binding domain-containing protein [Pseudomonadota bacterium]
MLERTWYQAFHDLMAFRVREILLVSSSYDHFSLEEDCRLVGYTSIEHHGASVTVSPRITCVTTGAQALEALAERRFELVLIMPRIADMELSAFGRQVHAHHPNTAVVLLVRTEGDLSLLPGGVDPRAIDRVFMWTGDASLFLAIIKWVEDVRNVTDDTAIARVRVIVLVESSLSRYSSFLSLLYQELMVQSDALAAEGASSRHRLLRMRSRPKILLATSCEEAIACYRRFQPFVVGVITGVPLARGRQEDRGERLHTGIDIVSTIRSDDGALPVLVLTDDPADANVARATALGVDLADRSSPSLRSQVESFLRERLGFGEFTFRMPDGREVGRVRDLYELERVLRTLPDESLLHHATRHHFSLWLMARSAFDLAERLRPQSAQSFGNADGLRRYLLGELQAELRRQEEGAVSDFAADQPRRGFSRIGRGSMGAKARHLAFFRSLLVREKLQDRLPGLTIRIPRTAVVCTDEYDRFVEQNRIEECWVAGEPVLERCLAGRLSDDAMRDLRRFAETTSGPISVRSSSPWPLGGIFASFVLPHNDPDPAVRLDELARAVRAVYASAFSAEARAYAARLNSDGHVDGKMAVLLQQAVGRAHGTRFYPVISGVALSHNYCPGPGSRREDGVVLLAFGFGHTISEGRGVLQFCPRSGMPAGQLVRCPQLGFYALDLTRTRIDLNAGPLGSLRLHDLNVAGAGGGSGSANANADPGADADGTLALVGGMTFQRILEGREIPLAKTLAGLLDLCSDRHGCPVAIEFAVDTGADGWLPGLYVLQVRTEPSSLPGEQPPPYQRDDIDAIDQGAVLCQTDRFFGAGTAEDVRDVVLVKRRDLDSVASGRAASEIAALAGCLSAGHDPFVLVGPGRWGTEDPRLGIPVKWQQVAGASAIVETCFADRSVEPSQASHFFQNVAALRVGYFWVRDTATADSGGPCFLDAGWLHAQPAVHEGEHVSHVRLDRPLRIHLDGRRGRATILKPIGRSPS